MTRIIIIVLILALLYLYYQNRKLKGLPNTSAPQTIFELDEDLIADKDEAIRKKQEAEQEASDFSNKLKLKNQEVTRKDQEIDRLKDEKSKVEIALNDKIKELKQDLTSEKQQHKGSLERIAKLTEQKAELATQIQALKKEQQKKKLRRIRLGWLKHHCSKNLKRK